MALLGGKAVQRFRDHGRVSLQQLVLAPLELKQTHLAAFQGLELPSGKLSGSILSIGSAGIILSFGSAGSSPRSDSEEPEPDEAE